MSQKEYLSYFLVFPHLSTPLIVLLQSQFICFIYLTPSKVEFFKIGMKGGELGLFICIFQWSGDLPHMRGQYNLKIHKNK